MKKCGPGCEPLCDFCKFLECTDLSGEGVCQNPDSPNCGKTIDRCDDCAEFYCFRVDKKKPARPWRRLIDVLRHDLERMEVR